MQPKLLISFLQREYLSGIPRVLGGIDRIYTGHYLHRRSADHDRPRVYPDYECNIDEGRNQPSIQRQYNERL